MKTIGTSITGMPLLLVGLVFGLSVWAGAYSIDWYTIDGGGGSSTGGVYEVRGTIGQPDAGPIMSGGPYALQGGFWGAFAVQVPGAPWLYIAPAGSGQVTIAWTPDDPGWVLQYTTRLELNDWDDAASGSTNPVTISPAGSVAISGPLPGAGATRWRPMPTTPSSVGASTTSSAPKPTLPRSAGAPATLWIRTPPQR